MAPVSALLRQLAAVARRVGRAPADDVVTPVEPLSLSELLRIFPGQLLVQRTPTLDFDLTQRLAGRWWPTVLLSTVPTLRTHLLARSAADQPVRARRASTWR